MKQNEYLINNKDLMIEWDYEKKYDLDPAKIKIGSGKKAWWICKSCGKKWQTQIYLRKNHGCPFCAHKRVGQANAKIKNANDSLINKFPDVIKVWNYEKNKEMKPEDFSYQSNKKVWWKCSKCEKEWQSSICAKSHTTICKECTYKDNKRVYVTVGINDLKTKNPELLKEWDYTKNTILPSQISPKSAKMVWWKCDKGHEWQADIGSRSSGSGCPICSGRQTLSGYNDLATTNPELLKYWDYDKNTIKPDEVGKGSHADIWWKCLNCGKSYSRKVYQQVARKGKCKICHKI